MNYRNRKFLNLAHDMHECTLMIPSACIGYSVDGCEPAHANSQMFGKGMGIKADDIFAAACPGCHFEIDQGKRLSKEDRLWYWMRGAILTMARLMQDGKVGML